MIPMPGSPLGLEAGLGILMILVFFVGVWSRGQDRRLGGP